MTGKCSCPLPRPDIFLSDIFLFKNTAPGSLNTQTTIPAPPDFNDYIFKIRQLTQRLAL